MQRNEIPRLVADHRKQRNLLRVDLLAIHDFPVLVGRSILTGVVHMALQRTAADVGVSDNHLDALGRAEFIEVLFDGILRKTIADGQNPHGAFRSPAGAQRKSECDKQQQRHVPKGTHMAENDLFHKSGSFIGSGNRCGRSIVQNVGTASDFKISNLSAIGQIRDRLFHTQSRDSAPFPAVIRR